MLSHRPKKQSTRSGNIWQKLDDYQRSAVEFALKQKNVGLFFEQGTGKTWITAGVIEQLKERPTTPTFLVIVPLANIETTWYKLLVDHVATCRDLETFDASREVPTVLLLHYEALNPKLLKKLRKRSWTLIVFDESQRLKSRMSIASRNAAKLSASAEHRIALSGTPMDERPTDLFGQLRFIKPSLLGSWKEFEDRWLEPVDADLSQYKKGSMRWKRAMHKLMISKNKREFIAEKMPEFINLIRPHCLRVEAVDVLELPPMTHIQHNITLRGSQRRLYDQLDRSMVASSINLTAAHQATKRGKLLEICGGWVINDDGDVITVGDAKLGRLRHLLRTLPRPLVIFFRFTAELEHVATMLDIERVGIISGSRKKTRAATQEAFQRGEIDVLLCQVRAGGVGLDLYAGCTGIVYSLPDSFIDFSQLIARLHRRGQEFSVAFHLLIIKGTVDSSVYQKILSKTSATTDVLKNLKETRDERREEDCTRKGKGPEAGVRRQRTGQGTRHRAGVGTRRAA